MHRPDAPFPHAPTPRAPTAGDACDDVCVVILAAGRSSRTAPHHKLLARYEGMAQIERMTRYALASQARQVVVVLGHAFDRLEPLIRNLGADIVVNAAFGEGLSGSVKAGFRAAHGRAGVMLVPADMPLLGVEHLDRLIAAFRPGAVVVATDAGALRNPAILPGAMAGAIDMLTGDAGARALIRARTDLVCVELGPVASCDADTPAAIAACGGDLPKA